jgi:hypothetical protein
MSIAFDAASGGGSGGAGAISNTHAHTCTGSQLYLVVATTNSGNFAVSTVTYNGVTMQFLGSLSGGTAVSTELWGLVNPATGAHNVVVTFASSCRHAVTSCSYTGVDPTTPTGTVGSGTASSGSPLATVSSAVGEVVVDAAGYKGANTITATVDASQTQRIQQLGAVGAATNEVNLCASDKAGAASITMKWTLSGGDRWVALAVPLKPFIPATSGTYQSVTSRRRHLLAA